MEKLENLLTFVFIDWELLGQEKRWAKLTEGRQDGLPYGYIDRY